MDIETGGTPEKYLGLPKKEKAQHVQRIEEDEESDLSGNRTVEAVEKENIYKKTQEENLRQLLLEIDNDPNFWEDTINKPHDLEWYYNLLKISSAEDVEFLTGEGEKRDLEKKKFLNGETDAPVLDYPLLNNNLEKREGALLGLKRRILEQEQNPAVKQIYRWKLNESIAILKMLEATRDGNNNRFERYQKFIYGEVDKGVFDFTRQQALGRTAKFLESDDPEIKSIAERLRENLSKGKINPAELTPLALEGDKKLSKEKNYTSDDLKKAFEEVLLSNDWGDWEIVISKDVKWVNTYQGEKRVKISENVKRSELEIAQLVGHEIETHVAHRQRGERSKLKLLGLGLDRYLPAEEGIATLSDQRIGGATSYSGLDYYLTIGLARGTDGEPRTFKEVFDILNDYNYLRNLDAGMDKEKARKGAANTAYTDCERSFRGLNDLDSVRGYSFNRNLVYRKGNIAIWNLIRQNPEAEMSFTLGKFDPTNPRHLFVLTELGITDQDLTSLEKTTK